MRFLVFQHIACEHPGIFRKFLSNAEIEWDTVALDNGDTIPPMDGYDALWVMGGPMDVWDEDKYPWLRLEKEAIRDWVVDVQKPYLGVCLGHQLLADAMGGQCGPQRRPEIGILTVELNQEGQRDKLFAGIDREIRCLQWHSVEVRKLPPSSVVLASSSDCRCQAMRVGKHAWGVQFHVELEENTIEDWSKVPAYARALEETLGDNSLNRMKADAKHYYPGFQRNSSQLFDNFLSLVSVSL